VTTRSELIEDGTPIVCARKHKTDSHKPAGSFFLFRRHHINSRKQLAHATLSKEASIAEEACITQAWHALTPEQRATWSERAKAEFNRAQLDRLRVPDAEEANPTTVPRDVLWGLNSGKSPLSQEVFEGIIRDTLNTLGSDCLPGSRQYCKALRDHQLENIFVAERGDP
jgi:hypothetical protein